MLKEIQVDFIDRAQETDIKGNLAGVSLHWLKEPEKQTGFLYQLKGSPIYKIKYKKL